MESRPAEASPVFLVWATAMSARWFMRYISNLRRLTRIMNREVRRKDECNEVRLVNNKSS